MNLVVRVKLIGNFGPLEKLLEVVNAASTDVARTAFEAKEFNHFRLRSLVYRDLRARGFSSGLSDLTAKRVAKVYSNKRRRSQVVRFRPFASVPLDRRLLAYKHGEVSIKTFAGRVRLAFEVRPGVVLSNKHEATLSRDEKGRFFLNQVVEIEAPEPTKPEGWLGVDLGVKNIAVDSDGEFHSGKQVNGLRRRHVRLRKRLQSKGTKSAKRLLRKRRRKEGRFARDVNHVVSKKLVAKANGSRRGIALENLKGIRARIKASRAQRGVLHSWSFGQLASFVEYKAKRAGVEVVFVDPKNTSRECPSCGHVAKENRATQARFLCVRCGCAGHADAIAALNIEGRASGFKPNAARVRSIVAATQGVS